MNTWTEVQINNKLPKSADKQAKANVVNVQLFMSAKNLKKMDKLDDSDPFCSLYMRDRTDDQWELVGSTETIDNNLNPSWIKHFDLAYEFHKNKQLKFEVYDDDDDGKHELIGDIETTIIEIMIADKLTLTRPLQFAGKKNRGILTVRADTVTDCDDEAKLAFIAKIKSHKILCYGSDNPYLMIERSRTLEDGLMSPRTR